MLDVFEILKEKIAAVPEGEHLVGLRAVQLHTETAIRHYNRGQAEQDGTAFTDAIYRCNQAFEGSAKEAYRVLAEKDPDGKSTYTIEEYLSKNSVLRQRVLSQFKRRSALGDNFCYSIFDCFVRSGRRRRAHIF